MMLYFKAPYNPSYDFCIPVYDLYIYIYRVGPGDQKACVPGKLFLAKFSLFRLFSFNKYM